MAWGSLDSGYDTAEDVVLEPEIVAHDDEATLIAVLRALMFQEQPFPRLDAHYCYAACGLGRAYFKFWEDIALSEVSSVLQSVDYTISRS